MSSETPRRRAGSATAQTLRQSGLVTRADLARAEQLAKQQRIGLERATVTLGLLTEDQLLYLVAETHGVDLVFPNASNVDADLLARFPLELLRREGAIPLIIDEGNAVVAFAEVPSPGVLAEFAHHAALPIRPVLASTRRLQKTLDQVLGVGVVDADRGSAQDLSGMTAFYRHLNAAFGAGADELRFEVSGKEMRVRARKSGVLVDEATEPAGVAAGIATRARLLAHLPPSTSPQTADLTAQIAGREVALRVAIVPGSAGELVVLSRRDVLPSDVSLPTCGLAADVFDWLRGPFCAPAGAADAASGLVLVAATDAELLGVFARAVLDGIDPATSVAAITRDARLDGRGRVRIAPPDGGLAAAVRCVRTTRPDVLFVDGGDAVEGLSEAAFAAVDGARVIFGLTDPQPQDAVLALIGSAAPGSRMSRALAAVVLVDRCRALCRLCSRPDPQADGWEGARVPVGCKRCDGRGFDGAEIVAAGARAVAGLSLQTRLRELVTSGRVSRTDACAWIPSLVRS